MITSHGRKKYIFQCYWEPVAMVLIVLTAIVVAVFLITCIVVTGYKKIKIFNEDLEVSRIINKQYSILFNMELNFNESIITKKQMNERQKLYDKEQQEIQREALLIAETEISKEICPVGTYVYLKDLCMAVRVRALSGFQAETYEQVYFLTCDTDSWYTLSWHEYNLFKSRESNDKNEEE